MIHKLGHRRFAVFVALATVMLGMAYTFWWDPVVHHQPFWMVPGDVWFTLRSAHFVGWGDLSYIYSSNTNLVSFPGFPTLLAPFAVLSSALNLTESAPWVHAFQLHPTSWLLIGPVIVGCSGVLIVAADVLAARLGLAGRRRYLVAPTVAAVGWPTTVMWGHGEDALAVGLALIALARIMDGHDRSAGWMLGVAIIMQPLVVLVVPLWLSWVGARRTWALLQRAAVAPFFFLVAVLVPDWSAALRTLTRQPNFPTVDYPTPWVLLAPHLGHGTVAAGPSRFVAVCLAMILGVVFGRRFREDRAALLWMSAVVFGLRCVFESVMVPYYFAPALVLAGIAALTVKNPRRAAAALAGAIALTVVSDYRSGMWFWYSRTTVLLVVLTAPAWPGLGQRGDDDESTSPETAPMVRSSQRPALPVVAQVPVSVSD